MSVALYVNFHLFQIATVKIDLGPGVEELLDPLVLVATLNKSVPSFLL